MCFNSMIFINQRLFSFLTLLLFILFIPIETNSQIIVEPRNAIGINHQSTMSSYMYNPELSMSRVSLDRTRDIDQTYIVNGAIYTNCPPHSAECAVTNNMFIELNPVTVDLVNGSSVIKINLTGMIEGITFNKETKITSTRETFHAQGMPWQSNLQILGELDPSIDLSHLLPGIYEGSFTVRLIIH